LGVAQRVAEILAEYEIAAQLLLVEQTDATTETRETNGHSQTIVTVGRLSSGFGMPHAHLLTHIEADLFDEAGAQTLERRGTGTDGRRQTKKIQDGRVSF